MFTSTILFATLVGHLSATAHAALGSGDKRIASRAVHNAIVQQDFKEATPFPILDIGLQHIVSDLVANGSQVDVEILTGNQQGQPTSPEVSLLANLAPTQCSPTSPCIDGSCCNTVG
jgi:hypothetical protein